MKIKNLLVPVIAAIMLCGCKTTTDQSSIVSSADPSESSIVETSSSLIESSSMSISESSVTSSVTPSSSSSKAEPLVVDPISSGSASGSLVEISVGRILTVGDVYTCSFVPSDFINPSIYIVSTVDGILETSQRVAGANTFTIKPLKAGQTILKIYTVEDDCLVYRDVITCADPLTYEEALDAVFETYDIWESSGLLGEYRLTFLTTVPKLSGRVRGTDNYEYTDIRFDCNYVDKEKLYDFSFYCFEMQLDLDNSQTQRKFTYVDISVTADCIYIYYDEGLFEMFTPVM